MNIVGVHDHDVDRGLGCEPQTRRRTDEDEEKCHEPAHALQFYDMFTREL